MINEDTMCVLQPTNNKISIQEMLYLWKMFTNRKQIPKVITKNRLIELLKGVYEFKLVMLFASVSLWKKYHPNHTTILYCDEMTEKYLSNLNVFPLWDQIRHLS